MRTDGIPGKLLHTERMARLRHIATPIPGKLEGGAQSPGELTRRFDRLAFPECREARDQPASTGTAAFTGVAQEQGAAFGNARVGEAVLPLGEVGGGEAGLGQLMPCSIGVPRPRVAIGCHPALVTMAVREILPRTSPAALTAIAPNGISCTASPVIDTKADASAAVPGPPSGRGDPQLFSPVLSPPLA